MFHCDVFCRRSRVDLHIHFERKGGFSIVIAYAIPASRHKCAGAIWLMRYTLRFSGSELVSIPYGSFDMICLRSSMSVRHELILPLLRLDWLVACLFLIVQKQKKMEVTCHGR